jgi:drug/metabolite transporter (DMT)-like permease
MSALTLGIIAAFAWGFHDICVRKLSQHTPLMASLLTVLIVGLAFHIGVMVFEDGFTPLTTQTTWLAVISGAFFLMASLGLYAAFQRGPVKLVAPIISSYPVLSVGWALLRGAEVSAGQWTAVIAIVVGVSLVAALAQHDDADAPRAGPTIAFALIAAVGFAGTFAIGQYASEISDHLPVTLVTRITALAILIGAMGALRLPFWPGIRALPVLALMGIADGLALLCLISAGGLPDAQYAAVASSCFGLLTILMAWAFLREVMTLPQWAGCAIAFAGIGYLAV